MKDKNLNHLLCALAAIGASASAAQAQLSMTWFTHDGAGGKMFGGDMLELEGTVGQPDVGTMTGSGFEMLGGYWGLTEPVVCWVNCDKSTTPPILNVQDFSCFLNEFAAGHAYANCDESTTPPVLNVLDFGCFLNAFAVGCS